MEETDTLATPGGPGGRRWRRWQRAALETGSAGLFECCVSGSAGDVKYHAD
jgi:hypothetical protein